MMTMGGNKSRLEWHFQSKQTKNQKKLVKSIRKLALQGGNAGSYKRAFTMAAKRVWGSNRDRYVLHTKMKKQLPELDKPLMYILCAVVHTALYHFQIIYLQWNCRACSEESPAKIS